MNPITHLLVGWTLAEAAGLSRRRDRAVVALAGIVPDLDGLGIIAEKATLAAGWSEPLLWWTEYHHVLGHNVGAALFAAGLGAWVAGRGDTPGDRPGWHIGALAFLAFHLHLLGDLIGGKGPDGYLWPMPYLLPFFATPELSWQGAWELNAWPNIVLTVALLTLTFRWAWQRGRSPLELVSTRADASFVQALRGRFGPPAD